RPACRPGTHASSAPRSVASTPPTSPKRAARRPCLSIRPSSPMSGCARISGRSATCTPGRRTSSPSAISANWKSSRYPGSRRAGIFSWWRPVTRCWTTAKPFAATRGARRSWWTAATTACRAFRGISRASWNSPGMQLLYEEDGDLKVGAVLGESPAAFQVESPHGRRSKIKAANVLLAFERPSGAELLAEAEKFAQDLDIGFLWECSGSREFGFRELAKDYVGREPTAVEAAGVLIKLHSAPMYFYRRGKGRFQAAPQETLKLALAAVEKKKRVQEAIAAWAERLARFDCPPEVAALKEELLYSPDLNKATAKSLEQPSNQVALPPTRLFERCGLLPDAHEYHLQRFVHELFPRGARFPAHDVPGLPDGLPLAEVRAFSLDDVGTSEIDDAFSLQRTGE